MKATQAQCNSTGMTQAMRHSHFNTPQKEVLLLESPNTHKQRQAREQFYKTAGQAQGLHVRF